MSSFTKEQEQYLDHEIRLRLHDKQFTLLEAAIERWDKKLDISTNRLDSKLDGGLKHLDNKFMWMFGVILGSIWLPAILHYLHITS
jgi:hypothetical protein